MNDLMVWLYDALAVVGALLLVHVIIQAGNDLHIKRTDPAWVIRARKVAFFSDAAFLFLTVCFQNYWLINPTTISVGIVVSLYIVFGGAILVINVVSLRKRAPPSDGHKSPSASRFRAWVGSYFIWH